MASQIVAAVLEYARLKAEVLPIPSNCAPLAPNGEHVRMSAMSAFWMVLPYAMIGIGGSTAFTIVLLLLSLLLLLLLS